MAFSQLARTEFLGACKLAAHTLVRSITYFCERRKEGPQRHIESVIGGANQISQRPVPIFAFVTRTLNGGMRALNGCGAMAVNVDAWRWSALKENATAKRAMEVLHFVFSGPHCWNATQRPVTQHRYAAASPVCNRLRTFSASVSGCSGAVP
jgi:hypothetical protein